MNTNSDTSGEAMKDCMSNSAGIVRSYLSMHKGLDELKKLHCLVEQILEGSRPNWMLYETRNLLTVGMLILQEAREQTQNRGSHHNCDLGEIESKKRALTIL